MHLFICESIIFLHYYYYYEKYLFRLKFIIRIKQKIKFSEKKIIIFLFKDNQTLIL